MKDKERAYRYGTRISGTLRYGGIDYLPPMNRSALQDYVQTAYLAGLRMGRKLEREAK